MHLPRPRTSETILNCIQAMALILGGCWVAFQYFAHERASRLVALRQSELANQASMIQLSSASQHDILALRQQELANAQAKLTLEISEAQRKLRDRELTAEVTLKERDIELRRYEAKKAEHDANYSGRYRFQRDLAITAVKRRTLPNGLSEYEVRCDFAFTNHSEVPFHVSVYVLDVYVGTLKPAQSKFWRLNKPNLRGGHVTTAYDGYSWALLGSLGGIYGSPTVPTWVNRAPVVLSRNIMGTGEIKPGGVASATETFHVTGSHDDYVLAFLSYCFNDCKDDTDDYTSDAFVSLGSVDASTGIDTQPHGAGARP